MKKIILLFINVCILTFFIKVDACISIHKNEYLFEITQKDTFLGNYVSNSKKVYMFENAELNTKTKIKLPKNVFLNVKRKSGEFVYGEFSVSSKKTYKGWFLLKELTEIKFSAPIISN